MCAQGDDLRSEILAPSSATGDTVRSETTSGPGVSLLFFILQEVGWLVSSHPLLIHHPEGSISTGVVHTAQRSVPVGRQRRLRPIIPHLRCHNKCKIIECILTLYHREYSRAHIRSSRATRCRDTSNPVEC